MEELILGLALITIGFLFGKACNKIDCLDINSLDGLQGGTTEEYGRPLRYDEYQLQCEFNKLVVKPDMPKEPKLREINQGEL